MLKEGRFRAIRNMPIGWVLQAWHSTDRSEQILRALLELVFLYFIYQLVSSLFSDTSLMTIIFSSLIITHTISWFITGNFWVYMLDSFKFVKNPGIHGVIRFVELSRRWFLKVDGVEAILIYGSACRNMFHIRSDLDLRVIRRRGVFSGWVAVLIGYCIRVYSFFIRMPVDLQVVDSMAFLDEQMREDELPIVVYKRAGAVLTREGSSFEELKESPEKILKSHSNANT